MFFKVAIICSIICLTYATSCHKLLGELGDEQMKLVYCITTNSVPVTMCIACSKQHEGVLQAYDILVANCLDLYFDKDRINLVTSAELALTGLWSKAYCDGKFLFLIT